MTTAVFNPVGYADGLVTGFTSFNGVDFGKKQASVADKFVVVSGGAYQSANFSATMYQTVTTRPNHYITATFTINTSGEGAGFYFNANSTGSVNHNFIVFANGSWQFNHEAGGVNTGSAGALAVVTGTPFTLTINAATTSVVPLFNGSNTGIGTLTTSRTGLNCGVFVGRGTWVGTLQIEPTAATVQHMLSLEGGTSWLRTEDGRALMLEGPT